MIIRIFGSLLGLALAFAAVTGCGDDSGGNGGCDAVGCDDSCQANGYAGGVCGDGDMCTCVGSDADADADTDGDSDGDTDGDSDADSDGDGFTATPGTQAEVDRTEPCDPSVDVSPKYAPQDGTTVRYCFPNYNIWAPLECGNVWDLPDECAEGGCASSVCLSGEAAKWVSGGGTDGVCACFNLCTDQADGATCGASGERPCVAIDDADGEQVFICGASL
jgi:hypothetical protein